ncbi:putative pre-16S rRNA nuclease [Rickettsiales bacterium]|nr:putative pre-16S rRNA nuclease [Rickettsiales bacterium]
MLYREIGEFAKAIKAGHRIIGLDIGEKKIGIAFSDTTHLIATAHSIYKCRSTATDLEAISRIIADNSALAAVVGLPLDFYDGQENEWCQVVHRFALKLSRKMSRLFGSYPIYLQDERFSTIIATRILKEANLSRKKAKSLDDKVAAANILQQALDKMHLIF